MMDNIASPYIKEFIAQRNLSKPQPSNTLTKIVNLFVQIQNCCERCATLWEKWNNEVAKMDDGVRTAAHLPARMLDGMHAIDKIAYALVSRDDKKNFGASLLESDLQKKQPLDNLFESADNKKQHEINTKGRALTHMFAETLMSGLLNEFLDDRFRQILLERSRSYEPLINGLYPLRRLDDSALKIKKISVDSIKVVSGKAYPYDGVKPFITSKTTPLERMKLYAHISLRNSALDKLPQNEAAVAPQWQVLARQPIAKDTCVGIQSGVLVDEDLIAHERFFDMDYVIDISVCGAPSTYLDCNGAMAKIRTGFAYDDPRVIHKSTANGCNVEAAKFLAEMEDGQKIYVLAIFALKNIAAGEELRIYSLTPPKYQNNTGY